MSRGGDEDRGRVRRWACARARVCVITSAAATLFNRHGGGRGPTKMNGEKRSSRKLPIRRNTNARSYGSPCTGIYIYTRTGGRPLCRQCRRVCRRRLSYRRRARHPIVPLRVTSGAYNGPRSLARQLVPPSGRRKTYTPRSVPTRGDFAIRAETKFRFISSSFPGRRVLLYRVL